METPINVWSEADWWLNLLWNVVLLVLPALLAFEGTARLQRRVRYLWKNIIRKAIDQTTDPAVVYLAAKTDRTPDEVSAFLVSSGDQIIALMPEEAEPLAERS